MNFKTTIVLIVLLAVVMSVCYFTGVFSNSPETAVNTEDTHGKKLLDIKADHVNKLAITNSTGGHTTLVKEGTEWKLTEPYVSPAASYSVMDLVNQLVGLRSQGRPENATDTGLDKPRYKVVISTDDGKSAEIDLGDKNAVGDVMFAKVDGGDVNLVDSSLDKSLKGAADTMRDKHLVAGVIQDQIRQIRITYDNKDILLTKPSTKWIVVDPERMLADDQAVRALLYTITSLEATQFVKSDSDEAAFTGLNRPTMKVWFSTEAPSTQPSGPTTNPKGTTIVFGATDALRESYFVQADGGPVAKVNKSSLDDLKKTPLDLKDKLVAEIPPGDVTRIAITTELFAPAPVTPPATNPSTQPATQPVAPAIPISSKTIVLVKRKIDKTLGPPAPTTGPGTTQPTTLASTQPATEAVIPPSEWQVEGIDKTQVDDAKVAALLEKFDPLKAEKFLQAPPATAPVERLSVDITAVAKGGGPVPYHFDITKPAGTDNSWAVNSGSYFEIDKTIPDTLDASFVKD